MRDCVTCMKPARQYQNPSAALLSLHSHLVSKGDMAVHAAHIHVFRPTLRAEHARPWNVLHSIIVFVARHASIT